MADLYESTNEASGSKTVTNPISGMTLMTLITLATGFQQKW